MIQFQCDVCGGFLKAADEKAGTTISCKLCGAEVEVPDTSFVFEPPPTDEPAAEPDGDELFAGLPSAAADLPKAPQPADFAAPSKPAEKEKEQYKGSKTLNLPLPDMDDPINRKLLLPSLAVMGSLIVSMLACVLNVVYEAVLLYRFFALDQTGDICSLSSFMLWTMFSGMLYAYALSRSVYLVMRIDYQQSLIAAILVMLPCGPCCLIGVPAGIWALMALRDEEVRQSFMGSNQGKAVSGR